MIIIYAIMFLLIRQYKIEHGFEVGVVAYISPYNQMDRERPWTQHFIILVNFIFPVCKMEIWVPNLFIY